MISLSVDDRVVTLRGSTDIDYASIAFCIDQELQHSFIINVVYTQLHGLYLPRMNTNDKCCRITRI